MRKLLLVVLLSLSGPAAAADLEEGKTYRLEISILDLQKADGSGTVSVYRPAKFVVVDASHSAHYVIRFTTLYAFENAKPTAVEGDLYRLPKAYQGAQIEKAVSVTYSGPVSGPLITPFKWRLNDKSLTGEATIGYYAGYSFTVPMTSTYRLPVVPFLSAGISQVNVETPSGNENKSAFTWAVGLLVQNWGDLNIGVLYGQDRTGERNWEHEGKGWFSFMVGWKVN